MVDPVKEEILNKADITDIIAHYVQLKNRGGRLFGLCPFHKEKTPSFTVNPDRGFFHCFGCGKGGNVIDFIMSMENLTYSEARRYLAQKLGIRIVSSGPKKPHEEIDRFQVMDIAAQQFYKWLPDHPAALEYVQSRGLTQETIKRFGIGFAPEGWDNLYKVLKQRQIPEKVMLELGLVVQRQNASGCYDRFRNRIIFPIRNTIGRVIAFGGRAMSPDDPAKYLNSNETSLFNKSKTLYLLNHAKNMMQERGAVLVEGYMDAVSLHIQGFDQTVANLGTALTRDHVNVLKRYTNNFTLLYDGDNAGINAAKKGVETFFEVGLSPKVVLLPHGVDPDDYIKEHGAQAMQELIDNAVNGFDFYLSLATGQNDRTSPQGKKAIVEYMLPLLARITEEYIRKDYIRAMARVIGAEVPALESAIKRNLKKGTYKTYQTQSQQEKKTKPTKKSPLQVAKEDLIRLLSFHHGLSLPPDMSLAQKPQLFSLDELQSEIPGLLNKLNENHVVDAILDKLLNVPTLQGDNWAAQMDTLFPDNAQLSTFLALIEAEPLPSAEKVLRKFHDEIILRLRQERDKKVNEENLRQAQGDEKKYLEEVNKFLLQKKGTIRESSSFF